MLKAAANNPLAHCRDTFHLVHGKGCYVPFSVSRRLLCLRLLSSTPFTLMWVPTFPRHSRHWAWWCSHVAIPGRESRGLKGWHPSGQVCCLACSCYEPDMHRHDPLVGQLLNEQDGHPLRWSRSHQWLWKQRTHRWETPQWHPSDTAV